MLIVALGASAVFLAIMGVLVLGLLMRWWGMATTELGLLPPDSGGVVVHEPARTDFSSEEAWEDYQAHWRDPYWDGEHPEGYRYKVASFVNEKRAGYGLNAFIAGCLAWNFSGEMESGEDAALADVVGTEEFYLMPEKRGRYATGQKWTHRRLMLYFEEDTDIWAKIEEVETAAEASGHDFHGTAGVVPIDSAWLPNQ